MKSFTLSIVLFSALFTMSCSNSGRRTGSADWCGVDYAAVNFEVAGSTSKTKLEDGATLNLKDGEYSLRALDMYIVDLERDIRLHVFVSLDEDGNQKDAVLKCAGTDSFQIRPGMEPFSYNIDLFSKLIVDSGKTTLGDAKLSVDWRDRPVGAAPLLIEYTADPNKSNQKDLKDTFDTFDERTQFLFEIEGGYELQNKLVEQAANPRNSGNEVRRRVETRQIWKKLD